MRAQRLQPSAVRRGGAASTPPCTRWVTAPPWIAQPLEWERSRALRPEVSHSCDALLGLLQQDVERGHSQLAVRHYLMLAACGRPVPADLQERCEAWLDGCKPARRLAIDAQVRRWADMVLHGPDPALPAAVGWR